MIAPDVLVSPEADRWITLLALLATAILWWWLRATARKQQAEAEAKYAADRAALRAKLHATLRARDAARAAETAAQHQTAVDPADRGAA